MKTIISICVILTSLMNVQAQLNDKCDTSVIKNRLGHIKLKKYYNQKVGNFMADIGCTYQSFGFVQSKPFSLGWCRFYYSDNFWIDVYVRDFKFMKKELGEGETDSMWKLEDFYKESISKTRIMRNGKTIRQYPKKPLMPEY